MASNLLCVNDAWFSALRARPVKGWRRAPRGAAPVTGLPLKEGFFVRPEKQAFPGWSD